MSISVVATSTCTPRASTTVVATSRGTPSHGERFVTTGAPSKELTTSLYYEGNSARNCEVTTLRGYNPF